MLADRDRGSSPSTIRLNEISLIIWLHVAAGVIWIGLLYYFNFVQVPALAAAAKDQGGPGGAGISKYVGPAGAALVSLGRGGHLAHGCAYLMRTGLFVDAFTLGVRARGR